MKRLAAFLAAAALVAPSMASADEFVAVGTIQTGNPTTKRLPGLTERTMRCAQPHERLGNTNGIDGYWIVLPADAGGRTATLEALALDADVWFYRVTEGGCDLIDANDDPSWNAMATDVTPYEQGLVPLEARYAIVNLVAGREAPFTFRVL